MIGLDNSDPVPPFAQIRDRFIEQIEAGVLRPGDRLPTVRQVAAEFAVATNTAARAYRELEQSGVVQTRGRAGTFVTGDQVQRLAKEAAVEYWERARTLGLSPAEALALVQQLHDHPVRSS